MKKHHHCPVQNKAAAAAAGCSYFDEKYCLSDLVDHMTLVEMEKRVHETMMIVVF